MLATALNMSIFAFSWCGGSASVPRSVEWNYTDSTDTCDVPPTTVPRTKPFSTTTCPQSLPRM